MLIILFFFFLHLFQVSDYIFGFIQLSFTLGGETSDIKRECDNILIPCWIFLTILETFVIQKFRIIVDEFKNGVNESTIEIGNRKIQRQLQKLVN